MKKNAFTLVELLAVIIILSIISIIAIPVVIDIINNSKNKSEKEAVNLYVDTIEKRIANQNLDVSYNPDMCIIQSTGDLLCLKNDEELYVDEEKTNKIHKNEIDIKELLKKLSENNEKIEVLDMQNKRINSEISSVEANIRNFEDTKKVHVSKKQFKEAQIANNEIKKCMENKSQLSEL